MRRLLAAHPTGCNLCPGTSQLGYRGSHCSRSLTCPLPPSVPTSDVRRVSTLEKRSRPRRFHIAARLRRLDPHSSCYNTSLRFASKQRFRSLNGGDNMLYSPDNSPPKGLSKREREVVCLLASGKANKEAANALGISVRTVEAHRAKIMLKLGIHSITELVLYAVRNKIVEP